MFIWIVRRYDYFSFWRNCSYEENGINRARVNIDLTFWRIVLQESNELREVMRRRRFQRRLNKEKISIWYLFDSKSIFCFIGFCL